MPDNQKTQPQSLIGPEFQSLPLPMILSAAMNGITSAQIMSARNTSDFLANIRNNQVNFAATLTDPNNNQPRNVQITVPELAVVPIPSIRVQSATIHFNFEIKEIVTEQDENDASANLTAGSSGWLSSVVNANISGSITHKSSSENTLNRSGLLDITINLSEPPMPEGLSKVLSILSNAIQVSDAPNNNNNNTAPADNNPVVPPPADTTNPAPADSGNPATGVNDNPPPPAENDTPPVPPTT